jgi:ABC-type uncharacterized transport system YnjBCD substrate-binding protein
MALMELAARKQSGLIVRLVWDSGRDQAVLRYRDLLTGEAFVTDVPNAQALAAFRHPNAFRPQQLAA